MKSSNWIENRSRAAILSHKAATGCEHGIWCCVPLPALMELEALGLAVRMTPELRLLANGRTVMNPATISMKGQWP